MIAGLMADLSVHPPKRFWQCLRCVLEMSLAERRKDKVAFGFGFFNPLAVETNHLLDGMNLGWAPSHLGFLNMVSALEANEEELLREQLTGEEIKRYRSLTHPKRRLEWLAGRIVAKGTILMYLSSNAPLACTIKVESSPDNAPYIGIRRILHQ